MFYERVFETTVVRAAEYVERDGKGIDRARVALRLRGTPPPQRLIDRMAAGQLGDGGWSACWSAPHASLEGSCHALQQLTALGPGDDLRVMRASTSRFLLGNQRSDGSWDEIVPGPLPPWLADELEARTYLTALCGSALVGTNGAAVRKAGEVVRRRVRTDGSLPGPIATQWLSARVLLTVGEHDLALAVLDPVVDVINELDPGWLAWMAVTVPDSNAAARARRLLVDRQRRDGGWATELGTVMESEIAATAIEALTPPP